MSGLVRQLTRTAGGPVPFRAWPAAFEGTQVNVTSIALEVDGRTYSTPVSEFENAWALRSIELRLAEIRADGALVCVDDDTRQLPIAAVTIFNGEGDSIRVSIDPCGLIKRVLARVAADAR